MKLIINTFIVLLILFLSYQLYSSIDSKMKLRKEIEYRNSLVIERLEHAREAQVEFKKKYGRYTGSFDTLIYFLKNDSVSVIRMEGNVPDSLLGKEVLALQMGIITRDTFLVPVKENAFKKGDFNKIISKLRYIPFSEGKEFIISSGEIEKGKIKVKVFEIKAQNKYIYNNLDLSGEKINLDDYFSVGSMTEPTINGNWVN